VGEWIQKNISAETWKTWIGQGTKVINELRLDFSRDKDQEVYDQHMHEYLGIDAPTMDKIRAGEKVAN
jgi:Fe-S cluster biosynthesis and repair protein YggX